MWELFLNSLVVAIPEYLRQINRRGGRPRKVMDMKTRVTCTKCGQTKDPWHFGNISRGGGERIYKSPRCLICSRLGVNASNRKSRGG